MDSKECPRCLEVLPTAGFSRNKNRKDGLQAYCKACSSKATKAYVAKNAARTSITRPNSKRCAACALTLPASAFFETKATKSGLTANCKDCHTALTTDWKIRNPHAVKAIRDQHYANNADKRRAYTRAWIAANRERSVAANRKWKASNRDRASAHETIRRGRKVNAPGFATTEQALARVEYYGGLCWICGSPWDELDHVKPISKGGSNWPANLRPACGSCNRAKSAQWPFDKVQFLAA